MKKGFAYFVLFIVWTILVKTIDVQLVLETGTMVGFGHLIIIVKDDDFLLTSISKCDILIV